MSGQVLRGALTLILTLNLSALGLLCSTVTMVVSEGVSDLVCLVSRVDVEMSLV